MTAGPTTLTLAAFLSDRLDEDETEARKYLTRFAGEWVQTITDPVIGGYGGQSGTRDFATGLYVGRMSDPARVLADVDAKRRIVALHEPRPGAPLPRRTGSRRVSHPDYREEWRP